MTPEVVTTFAAAAMAEITRSFNAAHDQRTRFLAALAEIASASRYIDPTRLIAIARRAIEREAQ